MTSLQTEDIPFSHKYAIRYYSFLIQQLIALALAFWSHNMILVAAFVIFHNVMCFLIPVTDQTDPRYTRQLNKETWVMGPCILSCLMTPVMLAIFWFNFDTLIGNSPSYFFAGILTLAFMVGGSIDAAHELLHRTEPILKAICYFNLFFYQFTVYPMEHLYLHHKKVGSPADPITSPKGKSFFSYYVNAISSAYKFNYNFDRKIFWMCVSATLAYNLGLVYLAIIEGSRIEKAVFFSLFSYVGLLLMESVEYIEHYGLVYRQEANSQPLEISSWNTKKNPYLSWVIFKFQTHSDHHMNAHKVYSSMEITEKMPQFPFDFGNAMLFAPIPSLWFKIADPLVDSVLENKSISKQYIQLVKLAVFWQRMIVSTIFFMLLTMEIWKK